ncbi:MAG TPA: hypothetical protein VGA47_01830 [Candidatus Dormibacteraeota bacterium]
MKAIGVVEGDGSDVARRRGPDALHQCEVTESLGCLFARAVGVLEVLEGEPLQFRAPGHCVELLVE